MKLPKKIWTFDAVVLDWHDGDTVSCVIDVGFHWSCRQKLRLAGLDSPELNSPDPETRLRAKHARDRAVAVCPPGSTVRVATDKPDSRDKFGRWLGTLFFEYNGVTTCLNAMLVTEGHGVPYDGGKRG